MKNRPNGNTIKNSGREVLKNTEIAIQSLSQSISSLEKCVKLIERYGGDIIITGIGKSGFVGQKIASTLTSLGRRASFLHPVEAIHGDIGRLSKGDVLLALSFSGESKEVIKIADYAKKHFKVPVIAFTQSKRSSLSKIADMVVQLKIANEGSPGNLAPMASTTATLVLGDMLSVMLMAKDFEVDRFAKYHPGGALGLGLIRVENVMKSGKDLPIVAERSRIRELLKEISAKKQGVTAVVNNKKKLVGVVTDGDIRRWLLKGGNFETDKAQVVMTSTPKTITAGALLKDALRIMKEYKITALFVTDEYKRPVGIIHIHDIIEGNVV
jgi:arabinose-5-phosphate isomerase